MIFAFTISESTWNLLIPAAIGMMAAIQVWAKLAADKLAREAEVSRRSVAENAIVEAKKAAVIVADKVETVADKVKDASQKVDDKLSRIEVVTDKTHALSNGNMGVQLEMYATLARQLADVVKTPAAEELAKIARKRFDYHMESERLSKTTTHT